MRNQNDRAWILSDVAIGCLLFILISFPALPDQTEIKSQATENITERKQQFSLSSFPIENNKFLFQVFVKCLDSYTEYIKIPCYYAYSF